MNRRQFVTLLGETAIASLAVLPVHAAPSDGCGVPVARDDGWPLAAGNEDKLIDRGALCKIASRLREPGSFAHRPDATARRLFIKLRNVEVPVDCFEVAEALGFEAVR